MKKGRLPELIAEIKDEQERIERLSVDISQTWSMMPVNKIKKRIHEESVSLKLHNFYTGCERIFSKIADELNGGVPLSKDWHKRLLHNMTLEIEGFRPPLISAKTEALLIEYLGFRHVVRNIYGYEIKSERLEYLVNNFSKVYKLFMKDTVKFLKFLKAMSE